jgi:hypothetical protein
MMAKFTANASAHKQHRKTALVLTTWKEEKGNQHASCPCRRSRHEQQHCRVCLLDYMKDGVITSEVEDEVRPVTSHFSSGVYSKTITRKLDSLKPQRNHKNFHPNFFHLHILHPLFFTFFASFFRPLSKTQPVRFDVHPLKTKFLPLYSVVAWVLPDITVRHKFCQIYLLE